MHKIHQYCIDAQILTGAHKGEHVLIPRIKLSPSDVNLPFTLERIQLPLWLAYCLTINKAQGQTFNKLGIFLPKPVFSHGQLYVAFSRARSFENIHIQLNKTPNQGLFRKKYLTKNIVFPEVF